MTNNHRVVIADDQAFIRKGLVSILQQDRDFQVVGEAEDGQALMDLLHHGVAPDVLILDLSMPKLSGFEVLRRIRKMDLDFKILVLTMHKEPEILCQTCSSGTNGYMLKDVMAKELLPALHAVVNDKIYLSPMMAADLPDTCWMKNTARQGLPASTTVKHCTKIFRDPRERDFLALH